MHRRPITCSLTTISASSTHTHTSAALKHPPHPHRPRSHMRFMWRDSNIHWNPDGLEGGPITRVLTSGSINNPLQGDFRLNQSAVHIRSTWPSCPFQHIQSNELTFASRNERMWPDLRHKGEVKASGGAEGVGSFSAQMWLQPSLNTHQ